MKLRTWSATWRGISLMLLLLLIAGGITPAAAQGGEPLGANDGNVQWNELYHNTPGIDPTQEFVPGETYTFRDVHPTGQVYDDTPVQITFMHDQDDLSDAYLRYWDGSEHWLQMTWIKNWGGAFHDQPSNGYGLRSATIPAHPAGTTVYYRIQALDGGDDDYLKAANGDFGGSPNPLGQHVRDANTDPDDWSYTVLDDDVTGPEFSNVSTSEVAPNEYTVCVDIADTDTVSGDDDSGVYDDASGSGGQGMYLLWATDQATVDNGGGTEQTMSGDALYCNDGPVAPGGATFYFRIYAHNNDADNGLVSDREQSHTGTYDQDGVLVTSGASQDGNVWWEEVHHDTRDADYRDPFGAVPTGQGIVLTLRTAKNDLEHATLVVYNVDPADDDDGTADGTWWNQQSTPVSSDATYDYYEFSVPAPSSTRVLYYKFRLADGSDCDWYVDDHAHNSYDHEDRYENGTGMMAPGKSGDPCSSSADGYADNSFNITVYDAGAYAAHLDTWAQEAVIYQIMPDRFRNGDTGNDDAWPAGYDVYGHGPFNHAAWNEAIYDPRDCPSGTYCQQWSADFFGGDLQGVIDELDYLQDQGITALYFNPIFASPSNHGYDTTDYLTINPRYGDNALFETLNTEAEARGIEIILDGVFNHTGSDSVYFDRYNRWDADGSPSTTANTTGACENQSSAFDTFYDFYSGSGPCSGRTDGNEQYASWWGYDSLPNLIDGVADNAVRDFVFDVDNDGDNGLAVAGYPTDAVIQFWSARGADGWRFDVADEIPHDFWQQFRAQVKDTDNLDGPLYSEVWFEAVPWLHGDQLDATMNYRYRKAVLGFLIDSDWTDNDNHSDQTMWQLSPSELDYVLGSIREDYPEPAWKAMMNLMDSHDTNRALFVLDQRSTTTADALKKMAMMAALQFTYPGAPTVYYGDEVGLGAVYSSEGEWGAGKTVDGIVQDDPYNRAPYPWPDESGSLPAALPNTGLQATYRTLALTRNNYDVLQTSDVTTLLADDANQVYAYARTDATGTRSPTCALAILNRDTSAHDVTLDLSGVPAACPDGLKLEDVLNGGADWTIGGGSLTVTGIGALSSAVLVPAFQNPNTTDAAASLPPTKVSAGSTATKVPTSGSTNVEAEIRDVAGQLLPDGVTVQFEILSGGGSLDSNTATTSGGTASVNYTAPGASDIAVVQAKVQAPGGVWYSDAATLYVTDQATQVAGQTTVETGIGPETVSLAGTLAAVKQGLGEPVVSLARLENVPNAGQNKSSYVDVHLSSATGVDSLEITLTYTDETGEVNHKLYWHDGSTWQKINGSTVDTDANEVYFTVTGSTTPRLGDLGGTLFVVGSGDATPTAICFYCLDARASGSATWAAVALVAGLVGLVAVLRRRQSSPARD